MVAVSDMSQRHPITAPGEAGGCFACLGSPLPYSATAWARLWHVGLRLAAGAALLAGALMQGGCAVSYRLDSILGSKEERKHEVTGTVPQGAFAAAASADLADADLVYAKSAAVELLARGGPDTSLPWANPQTGAHGTITPIAASYAQPGAVCRDFLVSYLRGNTETWLHGEACRAGSRWDIKSLKPFKRT